MPGGTKTGLAGMPRDPRADKRTRRFLQRLGGTGLYIDGVSITLNNQGEIQAGTNGVVQVGQGGTGDTSFVPYEIILGGVTATAPLQQVPSIGTKFQVLQSFGPATSPLFQDRGVVPGFVAAYAGPGTPPGWLLCDGASYATATYPDLFAAIGYAYGGSGPNFNVPNLVGHSP